MALGHGELAQEATDSLATQLTHGDGPVAMLEAVDHQLQGSRGAVAVSGEIDLGSRTMQIAGVGDMHAHICEKNHVDGVPFAPGVLGREHRTLSVFQSGFDKHGLVITASDGIRRNWDSSTFSGLFSKHPQLIAYTMGNIMGRVSDDQSLCVLAAA